MLLRKFSLLLAGTLCILIVQTGTSQSYFEVSNSNPYYEDFESGSLDTDYWNTSTSGRVQVTSSHSPYAGVYHMVLDNTTGSLVQTEAQLHLDLSTSVMSTDSLFLEFYWKEYTDETHASLEGIFISDNGGTDWEKVKALHGYPEDTWIHIKLNLRDLISNVGLSLTNEMIIKFQQYDDLTATNDGYAFDNIKISAYTPLHAELPYTFGGEDGKFDQYWLTSLDSALGRTMISSDYSPRSGSYHMIMDAVSYTSLSDNIKNSAYLFLDLSDQGSSGADVEMQFYYKDFQEDDNDEEGVYFSDDNGLSFTKILDISADHVTDYTWQFVQLDVDELASYYGLTLNDEFVIKFQQKDNNNIDTDPVNSSEGLAFDDIVVKERVISYAQLPYSEAFETGSLGDEWTYYSEDDDLTNARGRIRVTDEETPNSGSYHLVMNATDYTGVSNVNIKNQAFLYLDLSDQTLGTDHIELEFYWKHLGEQSDPDDGVWISDDNGNNFYQILRFSCSTEDEDVWFKERLFLDSLMLRAESSLEYTSEFIIKFQQYDNSFQDGIAIDDISITSSSSSVTYSTLPYGSSFETGSFDESWYTTSDNINGRVRVRSLDNPYTGTYHMIMDLGAYDGGTKSTVEAWLHLDLSSETEGVFMTYKWQDKDDETDTGYDAIFLSDDNGANFYEVQALTGTTSGYQSKTLDINNEIDTNPELDYTDQFVIKFQQRDDRPYVTSGTSDGFAFDDIFVANEGNCWIGTDSDWNNTANWSLGKLPSGCTCVVINPSATGCTYTVGPTISSDVTVGVMEIRTGGSLTVDAGTTLSVSENWINDGGSVTLNGTVEFIGDDQQEIFGSTIFNDIIINNTSVDGVVLTSPVVVTGSLEFTDGNITSSSTNTLTINDDATLVGCSSDGYVIGPLTKIGDDAFDFCVGSDSKLSKIGITAPQNGSATFDVTYCDYTYSDITSINTSDALNRVSNIEFWDISTSDSNTDVYITLHWEDDTETGIDNTSTLTIGHYNETNGEWEDLEQGTLNISGSSGSIQSNRSLSSFSPITFGTIDDSDNPLPVVLIKFEATSNQNEVVLTWETASEINNERFEIERSYDSQSWIRIGSVKGQGSTNKTSKYSFTDQGKNNFSDNLIFYRLKQIDFDGQFEYSWVESVHHDFKNEYINVFPNPAHDNINIEYSLSQDNLVRLDLYSMIGQRITTIINKYTLKGTSKESIAIRRDILVAGTYFIIGQINGSTIKKRIIIK